MHLYERNINSTVRRIDDERILTEASLLDLNHSMRVALTIHLPTRTIEKAEAAILKAPLSVCAGTVSLVKQLEGLKLERGVNKRLVQALAHEDGCTHLYELALNAVRLTFNVLVGLGIDWDEWVSRTTADDEFIRRAMPHLEGACRPFKK